MNKKIGMYASLITFLGALCFSIFSLLSSLLGLNIFRIGNHLSCTLIALGFIGMICSYITFIKDENKSIGLISLAFSIIYAIIILIISLIWVVILKQYSNLFSKSSSMLFSLELLGYASMTISSFFIGIKLEIKNIRELILKKLLCFQILFSIIWIIITKFLPFNLVYLGNFPLILLMIEIWCVYIILICIFSYLYFKNKDYNLPIENLQNKNINLERIVNFKQVNENANNNLFKNPIKYISSFWSKLAVIHKIIFVSIIIAIIGCFVALYTFLWIHLWTPVISFPIKDERALERIVQRIDQEDVKVNVTANGIIQVIDEATARRMRTMLITENLIPSGINPWEIFNKERWTATDFTNNVKFRQAQIQMITHHIKTLDGIDNANVNILVPEKELFRSDQKPITASVIITPRPGSDITTNRKKVEGIQKLLKYAVEGLKDENIVITDQNGTVLNDFSSMDVMDRLNISEKEQKLIQQLESKYHEEIFKSLKSIYSEDRIRGLGVLIELNDTNGEITIDRITVSVNIDGIWKFKYDEKQKFIISSDGLREREYIPIPDNELRTVVTLIQDVIGYNRWRGDSVTVRNIPFNRTKQFAAEDAAYFRWRIIGTILFCLISLVIISIIIRIIFSIKNYRKKRLNQSDRLLCLFFVRGMMKNVYCLFNCKIMKFPKRIFDYLKRHYLISLVILYIRYLLSLLVFIAGFLFTILLYGQSFGPLMDLPTLITVGLVPFLFISVLFGFKEMKAAYRTALQKEPDADRISKSKGFFNVFGATIWIMGMVSVIIGIIGMLGNLEDRASIGPNMALALLSMFYSSLLYLAAVFPFTLFLKKKQKAQSDEEAT